MKKRSHEWKYLEIIKEMPKKGRKKKDLNLFKILLISHLFYTAINEINNNVNLCCRNENISTWNCVKLCYCESHIK